MDIVNEILTNLNSKYVLLNVGPMAKYVIVNKLQRTMVVIDNPIINFDELIKRMRAEDVTVYTNLEDLPTPVDRYVDISRSGKDSFRVFIQKLYNDKKEETGSIIHAMTTIRVDEEKKKDIEHIMSQYAYDVLYPSEGINIYSNFHSDTASIIVVKGINSLPFIDLGETKDLYKW